MTFTSRTLINALAIGAFALAGQAGAALYWDGDDLSVDADGGAGTWDNSLTNWDTAPTLGANATWDGDVAIFGGNAGTVTLGDAITVNTIGFTTGGYTINSAGNTITLARNGGVRDTNAVAPSIYNAGTTTINANIDNGGFNMTVGDGSGTITLAGVISGSGNFSTLHDVSVVLAGANTYTGKTTVSSDTTGSSSLSISSFNSVVGGSASSSLGAPTTVADGTITLGNSGKRASTTLIYTGAGETTDRVINATFNSSAKQTLRNDGGKLIFTSSWAPSLNGEQTGGFDMRGDGDVELLGDFGTIKGGVQKFDDSVWTIGGDMVADRITVSAGTLVIKGLLTPTQAQNGSLEAADDVTVSADGTLNLESTSELLLFVDAAGINNSLVGTGVASLDGTLLLDLTTASTNLEDSWNLVDVAGLTQTFGSNFAVNSTNASFTQTALDSGVWRITENEATYEFEEATGVLTVIPEPGSLALLGLGGLMIARRRRG